MMEQSLVLVKPDAVERNIIGKILSIYEDRGLNILKMKKMRVSRELAEKHYEEHKGRDYYDSLINYITRSDLVALVLEGEDAISRIRKINGSNNPDKAEEGTIRKLYALSTTLNSVHASDSPVSAEREIGLWFD
ncbi:nucleoside diphosphate kinase [Clostridium amylolyticum]|uniref:Nucleoside diphosphate kinase n=1 Tax=Clostridium amylolyticum TaxID=1121298 RepID=A0A1M6MDD6_9CLOT|nr:nucleoside-diphosphate kinase [Clostridium amylolyticum]SHJ81283.1 nucleoside diphosphate kinase [Clostridium amylolyticum]